MAASCQLTAQANGSTARQGGQEAILVTAAHNATISVALTMAATYPTTATLYSGFDNSGGDKRRGYCRSDRR